MLQCHNATGLRWNSAIVYYVLQLYRTTVLQCYYQYCSIQLIITTTTFIGHVVLVNTAVMQYCSVSQYCSITLLVIVHCAVPDTLVLQSPLQGTRTSYSCSTAVLFNTAVLQYQCLVHYSTNYYCNRMCTALCTLSACSLTELHWRVE